MPLISPDVFVGRFPLLPDGRALVFVIDPGILLAGPIAVMRKLALATAMEFLMPLKASVADEVSEAEKEEMQLAVSSHRKCFKNMIGYETTVPSQTEWHRILFACSQAGPGYFNNAFCTTSFAVQ